MFDVTIVGSNSAAFAHRRHHSCQYLRIHNHHFLVDCGEGSQILLQRLKAKVAKVNHIFISHLHGDHYFGLIGLISSMHLSGRREPLHIYGPHGLSDIIVPQLRCSDTHLNFKLFHYPTNEGESDLIFEDDHLEIWTLPLDHRIPTTGFLFREKNKRRRLRKEALPADLAVDEIQTLLANQDVCYPDGRIKYSAEALTQAPKHLRSYAYCSDTRYKEGLAPLIHGSDLLYHEATFLEDKKQRAYDTFHSTAKQAAEIAARSDVSRLVLGHFSSRYEDLSPYLEEARPIFPHTDLAIEGKTFSIPEG